MITGTRPPPALPRGVVYVNEGYLYESGLRYEDLVAAVDVVVTKPGYGIISECVANDTALLYTSRGDFVEYDVLVREMPRVLRCAFIDQRRAARRPLARRARRAARRSPAAGEARNRRRRRGAD